MDIDIKATLRSSCRALLRPIASVVLKCGMTWREFSELSKSVFVSVATDEFGIRGRPTPCARISATFSMEVSRASVTMRTPFAAFHFLSQGLAGQMLIA